MTDQPKTVKARIPVAVDSDGKYVAYRFSFIDNSKPRTWIDHMDSMLDDLKPGEARYWIEAELPIPEITTVQATVTKEPSE